MIEDAAIRAMRTNYDLKSEELKRVVDAECAKMRAGRKPLSAEKVRSKKILVNLNESELARVVEAAGGSDVELARALRVLALEGADARLKSR